MFEASCLASCWEPESGARKVAEYQRRLLGAFATLACLWSLLGFFLLVFGFCNRWKRSYIMNRTLQWFDISGAVLALEVGVSWKLGSPRGKWTWSFLWICILWLVGSLAWSGGSFSTGASEALLRVSSSTWMDVAVFLAWGLLSFSQLPTLQNTALGLLLWQVSLNFFFFFTFLKILLQDWNRQHHQKGLGREILCKGVDVHGTKGLNCNTSAPRVQAKLTQTVSVDIAQLWSPWCYNHKITAFSVALPHPHNCPGLKKQTVVEKKRCVAHPE